MDEGVAQLFTLEMNKLERWLELLVASVLKVIQYRLEHDMAPKCTYEISGLQGVAG